MNIKSFFKYVCFKELYDKDISFWGFIYFVNFRFMFICGSCCGLMVSVLEFWFSWVCVLCFGWGYFNSILF